MVLDRRMEFLLLPVLGLAATVVVIAMARRSQERSEGSPHNPVKPHNLTKGRSTSFSTPTTQCPHCFQAISWEATVCGHCGEVTALPSGDEDSFERQQSDENKKRVRARRRLQVLIFSVFSLVFLLLGAILPVWPFLLAGSIIFGVLAFVDWRTSKEGPEENP